MRVEKSGNRRSTPDNFSLKAITDKISKTYLQHVVESIAYPKHYLYEPDGNRKCRDWITREFKRLGYTVEWQGKYDNIVAFKSSTGNKAKILFAAHYDTVPGCPGADDNGSAVAGCLECARILSHSEIDSAVFAIFNREEDGLLGSQEFVWEQTNTENRLNIQEAHVFEMIGYRSFQTGSQRLPQGLPVALPDKGDFLGLLANRKSNKIAHQLIELAETYPSEVPVLALKTYMGVEKLFSHLLRSDHVPFWEAGIPCIMWTDTSEFRNPHYHQPSDLPDTLDYDFLADVCRLAIGRVCSI